MPDNDEYCLEKLKSMGWRTPTRMDLGMQSLDSSFEDLGRICNRGDISMKAIPLAHINNNEDMTFNSLYFEPCLTNDCTLEVSTSFHSNELVLWNKPQVISKNIVAQTCVRQWSKVQRRNRVMKYPRFAVPPEARRRMSCLINPLARSSSPCLLYTLRIAAMRVSTVSGRSEN